MTQRIYRINQLLKEELGKILLKEGNFPKDCLVTITRVDTSVDLRQAKVWISVLQEDKTSEIIKILNKNIYRTQQKINKILKLKTTPKIKFLIEKKTREAARIEELLEKAKESG